MRGRGAGSGCRVPVGIKPVSLIVSSGVEEGKVEGWVWVEEGKMEGWVWVERWEWVEVWRGGSG